MRPLCLLPLVITFFAAAPASGAAATGARTVRIPAGHYRPLYGESRAEVHVAAFGLDVHPVTRGEFLAFTKRESRWRTDAIDATASSDMHRPVTNVSWTAARAYCEAQGKRLPTLAEWEYVAAASATARDATADSVFVARLIAEYSTRQATPKTVERGALNVYGVRGMHDLAWEWVADPNERFAASHSHHDLRAKHDMSCAGSALGAANPRNYPAFLRFALRSALDTNSSLSSLGFPLRYRLSLDRQEHCPCRTRP